MIRFVLALSVLVIASCSPAGQADEDARHDRDVFVGNLISLNGEPVESVLSVRFYSTDGDDVADRYLLFSDCRDSGYFDQGQDAFLSGYSPRGTGSENVSPEALQQSAEAHKLRHCPAEDPANFARFVDLMYEGATLEVEGDQARLTTKTGLSAGLARKLTPLTLD